MAKRIVWTEQAKADVRAIEQPIAIQILKTLARYVRTGEGATKRNRREWDSPGEILCLPR